MPQIFRSAVNIKKCLRYEEMPDIKKCHRYSEMPQKFRNATDIQKC